ncbi:MAG TPA: DNA repair protein RecO [Vagococcus sp.]|nr:DNA repair protein RecO [Vagococcus sp.]
MRLTISSTSIFFYKKGTGFLRHQEEVQALVLFSKNYREKDKLVKLFTESHGKKMFFVKNANRKNNPFQAAIQPYTKAVYIADIKLEGLSFLNNVKEIYPFKNIQQDIFISAYATYLLNLVDTAIEDGVYDPALYGFTLEALTLLEKNYDPEIITNIFEVQILERFGVKINWDRCAICGKTEGRFDFSSSYSGLLCESHFHMDERRSHFEMNAIHFIRLFSRINYKQISTIKLKPETKLSIRKTLDELYDEYVGIQLKSKKFITTMKSWENMLKEDK